MLSIKFPERYDVMCVHCVTIPNSISFGQSALISCEHTTKTHTISLQIALCSFYTQHIYSHTKVLIRTRRYFALLDLFSMKNTLPNWFCFPKDDDDDDASPLCPRGNESLFCGGDVKQIERMKPQSLTIG